MYKKGEVAIWLCIFLFSLFLKSLFLSQVTQTHLGLSFFDQRTNAQTHTYVVVKPLFITYTFFWFSLQNPFFNLSLPSFRSLYLSPTHTTKRRFFSSPSHALLFLTSHSFFSIMFCSSNFGFLSLHVGNKYWVSGGGFDLTPFCFLEYFQILFSISFGLSIVKLNWLHANGFPFKFFSERFDFEFRVFFFVLFGVWIDLGMNLCNFQFWCSVSKTCGNMGPGF